MPFNLTPTSATYNATGKFGSSVNGGVIEGPSPLPAIGQPLSISGFIKKNAATVDTSVPIGQNSVFYFQQNSTTGAWDLKVSTGGGSINGVTDCRDTLWHHIEICHTGSGGTPANTIYFFVDGILQGSATSTFSGPRTSAFGIRKFGGVGGFTFTGEVDEVAVWNSALHTAAFNVPTAPTSDQASGLVALYHLDGNANDTAGAAPADTTAPLMVGTITSSNITSSGFTLAWQAATDNVAVTGYDVSTNGGANYTDVGNVLTRVVSGLIASTVYSTRVRAYDAAGNRAAPLELTVTTAASSDTTAPTHTGSLTTSSVSHTGYTMAWPAASDNVAVVGYETSTDGGTTYSDAGNVTSRVISGAAASTTYQLRVRAYDAAGNRATPLSASVTTDAAPVIPPFTGNVLFSPYNWEITGTTALSINSGAYFRTMFSGTTCTLSFDVTGVVFPADNLEYRIDGSVWTLATVAASVPISIPSTLAFASGKHLLEVRINKMSFSNARWSTPPTGIKLTGITVDAGATLEKPESLPINVAFFGDSITEGYNTQLQSGSLASRLSYAPVVAEILGAELGVVAFTGQGFITAGNGSIPALTTTYDKLHPGAARVFDPAPALIVINEGTNDATGAATTSAAVTVINGLLAMTPSSTKIAVLRPFSGGRATEMQNAVTTVNSSRVSYINTAGFFVPTAPSDADRTHPRAVDNRIIGPRVAAALRPLMDDSQVAPTLTTRTITKQLRLSADALAANLTGLKVSFHDESSPDLTTTARYQSASETTDASGNLEFIFGSTLSPGQTGWLDVKGAGVHFCGPVVVA